MKTPVILLLSALLVGPLARAQDAAEVESLLKNLRSDDIETRYDAMFKLQTCLDPRIPDACLAVLKKEGGTIRRWAARAIGSRWWQIPKERVPVFTKALQEHLDSEHDGLPNMARRGIALLNRDYTGPMVSRSSNKRWVVYERYGLPCLIDTRNMTEELLGFPGTMKPMSAAVVLALLDGSSGPVKPPPAQDPSGLTVPRSWVLQSHGDQGTEHIARGRESASASNPATHLSASTVSTASDSVRLGFPVTLPPVSG